MNVAYVDFETRSRADLKLLGGRRYVEHPSTRVLCAVLRTEEGDYIEWAEGDACPAPRWGLGPVCAHNAVTFDRHVWRALGWPEPARWVDTAELAKVAGYHTAKLEGLAEHLLRRGKDMAGNALTLQLSKPEHYYGATLTERLEAAKAEWKERKERGLVQGRLPTARLKAEVAAQLDAEHAEPGPVDAEVLARVIEYCRSDVEIMAELGEEFLLQWLDSDLPGLEQADRALNDRGICFDRELAALLIDADAALADQALEAAGITDKVEVSPARLAARLAELGVEIENSQADHLEEVLKRPGLPERARRLIEARQASSSIAAGKLKAGLARCSEDGRLRDNRTYMGAHTGRWSGKGMQLDNLAKGL